MATEKQVPLPDIGDFEGVDVVEILVSPGDRVEAEDSLIVLESDKASMEIPAPFAGVVKELRVAVGDQVSQGDVIAVMDVEEAPESESEVEPRDAAAPDTEEREAERRAPPDTKDDTEDDTEEPETEPPPRARAEGEAGERAHEEAEEPPEEAPAGPEATQLQRAAPESPTADAREAQLSRPPPEAHASPSVRRLARELGVELSLVPPTGPKGRVLAEDVQGYVKAMLAKGSAAGVPVAGVSVRRAPDIDFAKFGETETVPLNRVRKLASANLHRSWVTVPHVTQFDEADVTELDRFRKAQQGAAERHGVKLTFLPFLLKACAGVLAEFPHFNASLDRTGENLVLKRYFHLGVAVETEHGLVVPVVRDVERKGLFELAAELQELSARARDRKLTPGQLQGSSFSISSLGGIGGRFFTPIVNHPEVAILGVSRMEWKPLWREDAGPRDGERDGAPVGAFVPRLVLPLSLSYDHRVIDGADAVRFTGRLAQVLSDLRLLLL